MKYFTPAWHSGELDDTYQPFEEYKKHLALLFPLWPPQVQTLATINLHDGLLWQMTADKEQETLLLKLRCGDLQVSYFDLELCYLGVEFSPAAIENLAGLIANPSDQDLKRRGRHSEALYAEVDMEGGMLVHRILFESRNADYHELTVQFKRLKLEITFREGRYDICRSYT